MKQISEMYIEGIKEGRLMFEKYGIDDAKEILKNLNNTIKGFPASSPVGQMLRGERDFWKNQLKHHGN